MDDSNKLSDQEFLESLCTLLLKNGYKCDGEVNFLRYNIFPDMLNTNGTKHSYYTPNNKLRDLSEESFNKQYIDFNKTGVLESSKILFKKKIVGLVSFFNEISELILIQVQIYFLKLK